MRFKATCTPVMRTSRPTVMIRQSLSLPRYRAYATNPGRNASPRSFRYMLAATAVVGATAVAFAVVPSSKTVDNKFKAEPVPILETATSVDAIEVASPVRALSMREANGKVREGARVFEFPTVGKGGKGRVDVVRVASNSPVEDEWAVGVGSGVGGERDGRKSLYAGVYDGHAGWAMSAVLKHVLIRYVSTSLGHLPASADDETVAETIQMAFEALDNRVMNHAEKALEGATAGNPEALAAVAPAIAGSCALLAMYDPASSTLRTAVTGDSRAVLGSWSAAKVQSDSNGESKGNFTAEQLTIDQTGFNAAEVARLQAQHPGEGPDMINSDSGRLFGLAVTRAFGDHRWKWPQDLIKAAQSQLWSSSPRPKADRSPPYLIARPEITTRRVQPATDFVILASDGLWDVMSNADAVTCVERWLAARGVGKPEAQAGVATKGSFTVDEDGYGKYRATPEHFAIEDLDNAAVCLAKNAFGGRRRDLFRGVMTAYSPLSRDVRDDVTIQVIFFQTPPGQS